VAQAVKAHKKEKLKEIEAANKETEK